jgi:hypothetical protein
LGGKLHPGGFPGGVVLAYASGLLMMRGLFYGGIGGDWFTRGGGVPIGLPYSVIILLNMIVFSTVNLIVMLLRFA